MRYFFYRLIGTVGFFFYAIATAIFFLFIPADDYYSRLRLDQLDRPWTKPFLAWATAILILASLVVALVALFARARPVYRLGIPLALGLAGVICQRCVIQIAVNEHFFRDGFIFLHLPLLVASQLLFRALNHPPIEVDIVPLRKADNFPGAALAAVQNRIGI